MRLSDLSRPKLFETGNMTLSDNEYIARNVINVHLNPNIDSGTRKHKTVCKSVEWIRSFAPDNASILDVGCGPGIYAKMFSQYGYNIVGIDISKYSIEYAKIHFQNDHNFINYVCADILSCQLNQKFDIILVLYALYSFFNRDHRLQLLEKLYNALNKGGKLVIEVFDHNHYRDRLESSDWKYIQKDGFWKEEPYLELNAFYRYKKANVVLIQAVAIDKNISIWNEWIKTFDIISLRKEFEEIGINHVQFYSDVTGTAYYDQSEIICAVITRV